MRLKKIIILFAIFLVFTLLLNAVSGQNEEEEDENGGERPILFGFVSTGISIFITALFLLFVKMKSDGRNMNQKLWLVLCIILCLVIPIGFSWISAITAFGDMLCILLMFGVVLLWVGYVISFYVALGRSVLIIKNFPNDYKVVISKSWKTILVGFILAFGGASLLLSAYVVYNEWGYWGDVFQALSYLGFTGILFIVLGVVLWKKWVMHNEIIVGLREIKRKRGKTEYSIRWDSVSSIIFDTHHGHRSRYDYLIIRHPVGEEKISNIDVSNQNEWEKLFFALLYNHKRSGSNASMSFKEKWASRWCEGYLPQIRELMGESPLNEYQKVSDDYRYQL